MNRLLPVLFLGGCFNPICGDGLLQDREECDQGNTVSGDGCDENCQLEAPVICGDDIRVSPEECDDGNLLPGDGCNEACIDEFCGDGVLNNRGLEQCDDGNQTAGDGCDNNCTISQCGNGVVAPDEECDDANITNDDACSNACRLAVCGDSITQPLDEACDDGDSDNFDDCLDTCLLNQCGDSFLAPGEECDDDNLVDGDGCSSTCTLENVSCGDGVIEAPEECDDANQDNSDACLNSCQLASCGDNIVQAGVEECDDSDQDEADNCKSDCSFPVLEEVHVGGAHICAVTENRDVRCWGSGASGQLGNGLSLAFGDDEPASLIGNVLLGAPLDAFSVGGEHSCVLFEGGARCWGANESGQLGNNTNDDFGESFGEAPSRLFDISGLDGVTQIVAGGAHTCAVLASDALKCWGDNSFGQLGYGDNVSLDEPSDEEINVTLAGGDIRQVALGAVWTCILRTDGEVMCWGGGASGALGYGDNSSRNAPEQVPIVLGGTTQLTAGGLHTCALLAGGDVRCWGNNSFGQLGYGDIQSRNAPSATSVALSRAAIQIAAGRLHTCALFDDGTVSCWGRGDDGQLGYGNPANVGDNEQPESVGFVSLLESAEQLSAFGDTTCALLQSGKLQCWGDNSFGQLGYGNTNNIGDDESPSSVGIVPVF